MRPLELPFPLVQHHSGGRDTAQGACSNTEIANKPRTARPQRDNARGRQLTVPDGPPSLRAPIAEWRIFGVHSDQAGAIGSVAAESQHAV
jgi:hypothetical protein